MGINIIEDFNRVYQLSGLDKNLERLFKGDTASFRKYLKHLRAKLIILDSKDIVNALQDKNIELLSGYKEDIYSITYINKKKNPRILFAVIDNRIILIDAFLEERSSDYRNAIDRFIKRIKTL